MSENFADGTGIDHQALEDLVVDNPDLERLEALLDQFNIFEAIGVVRQELRHSDFLAFLLNPQQPHGLGDVFLKSLLQRVLLAARGTQLPINLIDLDVWRLEDTTVQREWRSIDILLLNEERQIAVIIENKIGGTEHSDQLNRYCQAVEQSYPGYRTICLYLTPEGEFPSDERFLPVSYGTMAELVESLVQRRESTLGADIKTLMNHYAQMLRRHIVSESEIAELCRKIYQKHRRALDLIFERRPNIQDQIAIILSSLVKETDGLAVDRWGRQFQCFVPLEWDSILPKTDPGWSLEGRILLFWFQNKPGKLKMALEIGPGPSEARQRIFEIAQSHRPPFRPGSASLSPKYSRVWSRVALSYDQDDVSELEPKIRKLWKSFAEHDLPELTHIISDGFKTYGG